MSPAAESSAFFELIRTVEEMLHPPGKEKRASLMVPDSEWSNIDDWLEKWRGQPWPPRRAKGT